MKANLGISYHPDYITYSISLGKDAGVRTKKQQKSVNANRGVPPLSYDELYGIESSMLKGENIFASNEGEEEKSQGAAARLMRTFAGNSNFDETVNTMSYIGADGEKRFGYQEGNYHMTALLSLNNPEKIIELSNNPDTQSSHLLSSDQFIAMSDQGKLRVETIDGLRQVLHSTGDVETPEGEKELFATKNLEVNREKGSSFGDYNGRELYTTALSNYGIEEGARIQTTDGGHFYATPHIIGVMETNSTAHMFRAPVVHAVFSDKTTGKPKLSKDAIDILYNQVTNEVDRIARVTKEIAEIEKAQEEGREPDTKILLGYHTGEKRGLKLYRTAKMLGDLADDIEKGAQGEEPAPLKRYEIERQLRTYWGKQRDEFIQQLADEGLIEKKGDKIENKLLPGFLFTGFSSKERNEKMNLEKDNFLHNISQVFMNDYLNTAGMVQLLYGDEAKSFKGAVDWTKRLKGANATGRSVEFSVIAPELGITHPLTTFHHVMIPEPKFTKFDGTQGDKADAQMYMTEKALRYMLFGFCKLTKAQADILDLIKKGSPVAEKAFIDAGGLNRKVDAFNSLKNVYFDGQTYLKCSSFPLFKDYTSIKINGKWEPLPYMEELHHLRESLEKFEEDMDTAGTPTITFAHPPTASKAMKEPMAPGVKDIDSKYFNQKQAQYMRLQSENPSNKLVITDPTQLRGQLLAEQNDDTPISFMGVAHDTDGKPFTVGRMREMYLSGVADRLMNNYVSAANELFDHSGGIKLNSDISAEHVKATLGNFFDGMRDTLRATGSDVQTLGFTETRDGENIYDPNLPATREKFTQMYLSYFSKGVMSEKVPGIPLTLTSDYGVKRIKQVHELNDLGQPKRWTVITDREYKDNPQKYSNYHKWDNKEARTFAGLPDPTKEVVYFLDDLRHNFERFDEQGNSLGFFSEQIRPAHFKEEANGTVIPALKDSFITRIPLDDKHSNLTTTTVDILPAYYGSIGIHPAELTEISGADFDIDKGYNTIADTYRKDGTRVAYGTATTDKDKFDEYIKWQIDNNKNFKRKLRELRGLYNPDTDEITMDLNDGPVSDEDIADMFKLSNNDLLYKTCLQELKMPSTIEQFVASGGDRLNNGVLNNITLAARIALLNNKDISGGGKDAIINQPTDTKIVEDITSTIKDLLNPHTGEKGADIVLDMLKDPDTEINTLTGKKKAFVDNMEGQRNIGAAVNSMLVYSLLNQYEKKTSEGITFDGKMYNDFSNHFTENGKRKFSILSAIVNTMTDNAKLRLAAKLGWNIEAVGYVSTMVSLGMNEDIAALYMFQPAIRKYFKELSNLSGVLKTPAEQRMSKTGLLEKAYEKLLKEAVTQNPGKESAELPTLTKDMLVQNIIDNGKDATLELAAVRDLLSVKKNADTMANISKVIKLNQGLPPSWEDAESDIIDPLRSLGIVNGEQISDKAFAKMDIPIDIRQILADDTTSPKEDHSPVYGNYVKMVTQINELSKAIFLEKTDGFKKIMSIVGNNFDVRRNQQEEFNKTLKGDVISALAVKAYINWLQKTGQIGTLSTLDHSMIYDTPGKEGIVDIVNRLRDTLTGKNRNYLISKFLRLVAAGEKTNRDKINKAESNTWAKLSEQQQQRLVDSFTILYNSPKTRNDATALFNYLLVKDGGQFKSGSFIKFLPTFAFKDFSDRVTEVNKLLSATHYDEKKGEDVFGDSLEKVMNDIMVSYATHTGNTFFLKTIIPKVSGYVPEATNDRGEKVDIDRVKKAITSPVQLSGGTMSVDIFNAIRTKEKAINTQGIAIEGFKKTGKYDATEKALMTKNIGSIEASGFNTTTAGKKTEIEFPYSVKVNGSTYQLRSVGKEEGKGEPLSLIAKGETIPKGVTAVYEKITPKGSRGQWKAAGILGPLPDAVALPGTKKITNPPYADNAPGQKEIAETITTKVPEHEQATTDNSIFTATDKHGNVTRYDDKGSVVSSALSGLGQLAQENYMDEYSEDIAPIDWKSEIDKVYEQKGKGVDKEQFLEKARGVYRRLQGKVSDYEILQGIKDCI
jgi:hypothetical protein